MNLSELIKKLRKKISPAYTQKDLAYALGVSQEAVSGWEQGKKGISNKNLKSIGSICKMHGIKFNIQDYI